MTSFGPVREIGCCFLTLALAPACSAGPARTFSGADAGERASAGDAGSSPSVSGGTQSYGGTAGAGTGGASAGSGGAGGGPVSRPIGGWPQLAPSPGGVWVRVRNECSFPLWIHAAGNGGVLQPDDAKLEMGQIQDYVAPPAWSAARVTVYSEGPRQGEIEKAEMTIGGGLLNYNVTYVDWVGLPLEITARGEGCDPSRHTTGCYAKQREILAGCPEDFLRQGSKCLAARSYCLNSANHSTAYCHALDAAIGSCAACPGGSTPEVYACSGPYSDQPRLCAALNRGTVSDPDNRDTSFFYSNPPYNTYAKWVHQVCPGIYAFSYDDWLEEGGFRSCRGNELRITFCPAG